MFGMAYAGARGVTEREIADAMHFNYPQMGFHDVLKELNDLLESRGSSVYDFRLTIANSAWGRDDAVYVQDFLDTLSDDYGAEMQHLDFVGDPDGARVTISEWVSDRTDGLVTELIPPRQVDPFTYLVLANAIFFRAAWFEQFDLSDTRNLFFDRLDGSSVSVPTMYGEKTALYYEGDGFQATALPYQGEESSMLIVLPSEGEFTNNESQLTASFLDDISASLRGNRVKVYLPRFSIETAYDLEKTLKNLGMRSAFRQGADFSGMDGTADGAPWITFVAHKSLITVNEWGTMAGAGTAGGFGVGIYPTLYALRPFIFAIRDDDTGTILFLGRVVDPS